MTALSVLHGPTAMIHAGNAETRHAVLGRIPPGTPVDQARTIMQAEGFECQYPHGSDRRRLDLLFCRKDISPLPILARSAQLLFRIKGDRITDVSAEVGFFLP